MPATNPRISVTVVPSVDAVLSRLSSITGQSKSSFIAEILESSMPVFERMVVVLDAAQHAKDTLKSQTMRDMEAAEARLQEMLGITMDIFDETSAPILEEAERIKRRAVALPAAAVGLAPPALRATVEAPQPPYVTRGSGTPNSEKNTTKSTSKAKSGEASKRATKPVKPLKRKARG